MAISEKIRRRSTSLKVAVAVRRANYIVLIILDHKGDWERGACWVKSWAASMRLSHSATFTSCSKSSSGASWGSFGGMKTCSMTECKIELGSWAAGVGMAIDNETGDVTMVEQRQRVYNMAMRPRPGVVLRLFRKRTVWLWRADYQTDSEHAQSWFVCNPVTIQMTDWLPRAQVLHWCKPQYCGPQYRRVDMLFSV